MRIEVSPKEAALLADMLETQKRNLLVEIRRTWSGEYKQRLKNQEVLVEHLISELAHEGRWKQWAKEPF